MLKTPWKLLKTDLFFHIFHAHPGSISRNSDAEDLAVVLDLLAGGEDVLHGSLDVRASSNSTFIFWVMKLTVAFATPATVLAASSIFWAQFAQSTSIL